MSGSNNSTQNDTLTFVNEEMTYEEVKRIFGSYGEIKNVNKYHKRYFVQFESPQEAEMALFDLAKKYRVTYAHAKSRPRPKKNFRAEGELIRLWNPEDLPSVGNSVPPATSRGMAMIQEYIKTATRNYKPSSSRKEMTGDSENLMENIRGYESRSKYDKKFEDRKEKESQKAAKQDRYGKPAANPKPGSSRVHNRERDSSGDSDDIIEEPKAGKPKAEKFKAGQQKAEKSKAGQPNAEKPKGGKPKAQGSRADEREHLPPRYEEEDDIEAQARALSGGGRRRVRIEGLDEVMNELGNDMAYSVIVANIPAKYTLDEVYDLVEEVKPIAFSEMDYSIRMRVKFCEVFLNDAADVDYLKQKLNDFVICGKQLTVMEPAEILDETRWNA